MKLPKRHIFLMYGGLIGFAAVLLLLHADPAKTVPAEEEAHVTKAPLTPGENAGAIVRKLGEFLPRNHLSQKKFDATMSAVAWTNFITSLDFDRSYFLQPDIEEFATMSGRLGEILASGDVEWPYAVFAKFKERLSDRYNFVTNMLAQPLDFSQDEVYEWNRRKAPWPVDKAEQDDLWRRRIKNEYLGYVISRELDEEEAAASTNAAAPTASVEKVAPVAEGGAVPQGDAENEIEKPEAVAEGEAAPQEEEPELSPVTPEEFVAKRYRQFKIVIDDYDADFILQRFASSIASAYDPHSDYFTPAKAEDFSIDMNLSLSGIGATLRSEDGAAVVVDLIAGGPASRDTREIRLRPKDKIIGVAQGDDAVEDILHLPLDKAVRKIRGPKGTKVRLQVISGSDPSGTDMRVIDLIRDDVKLEAQAATSRVERVTMADGTVRTLGVVRLPAFYRSFEHRPGSKDFRSSTDDVAREIAKLNNENIEGLILDLRNNGGGALVEAVNLTGLFVREGPVVQVREPHGVQVLPIPERGGGPAFRKPMLTLVNRTSASASEIVAGALQDYGRSIILGDSKTHGKGTVQTVLPLDGRFGDKAFGSVKATTATFYRITGASTQLRGVVPDIVIPSSLDTMEIGEEFQPNPLPWTQIDAAYFAPVFKLADTIAQLKEKCAERLAADPEYQRYNRMVQYLAKLREDGTPMPLEYEARKAYAREEREMRKEQSLEEMEGTEEGAAPDATAKDAPESRRQENILMDEALVILADYITITGGEEVPLVTPDQMRRRMFRILGGF